MRAGELKDRADQQLFEEAYEDALRSYLQLLELQPLNLDARMRVGDALLALGEVQRAAVVYTLLSQYAAHAGYPLRAVVALKVLTALEPELQGLLRSLSELYARRSPRLGRGLRRSLPDAQAPVPRESLPPQFSGSELAAQAERIACNYAHEDALLPETLMPIPLLSTLEQGALADVLQACTLLRLRPGAPVIEQGSQGASMYLLARGSVRVHRREQDGSERELRVLPEGALFGELSFLSGAARSASVTAVTDCDVLELSASALERAGDAGAELRRAVATVARERMLSHVMANSPLFAPLDATQRLSLVRRFVPQEVGPGAEIVRQGEPSHGAFVVLRGEVVVERRETGRTAELARLGPGELFGEMSLLSGQGASATVRAEQSATLLMLQKPYFDRLVDALPELRAELEQLAGTRASQIAQTFQPASGASGDDDGPEIEIEVLL